MHIKLKIPAEDPLQEALRHESEERGISVAETVHELLAEVLVEGSAPSGFAAVKEKSKPSKPARETWRQPLPER